MLYTLYFALGLLAGSVLNLLIQFLPKQNNMFKQLQSTRNFLRFCPVLLVPAIGSFISSRQGRDCESGFPLENLSLELLTGAIDLFHILLCLFTCLKP